MKRTNRKESIMQNRRSIFRIASVLQILVVIPIIGITQVCQVHYQSVDVNEGLSSGYVNDLTRDGNGFLWIATQDGINRYDGRKIEVLRSNPNDSLSLAFDNVTALAAFEKGKLVLGGSTGQLQFLDFIEEKSSTLFIEELQGKSVRQIEVAEGIIYVTTEDDLILLNKQKQQVKSINPLKNLGKIFFIEKNQLGMIWLSSENGLYIGRDNGGFKKLPNSKGLDIIDITGNESESWALSDDAIYFIGSNLKPVKVEIQNFNIANFGFKMIAVNENDVLLGGEKNGFWVFNKQKNTIINCSDFSGDYPYYTKINAHFNDAEGNIFLGTNGDGLMHFSMKSIFSPFKLIKLDNRSYYHGDAFYQDTSGIHIITGKTIHILNTNGSIGSKVDLKSDVPSQITDMVHLAPYYALSSYEGIVLFDKQGNTVDRFTFQQDDPLSLVSNQVLALEVFDGKLWAASSKGLNEIDVNTGIVKGHLAGNYITDVFVSEKRLLVSSNSRVFAVDVASDEPVEIVFEGLDDKANLSISRLLEHKKNIWIGTKGNGIYKTVIKSKNVYVVSGLYKDQLSSAHITSMAIDEAGNIWAATTMGLNRIFPVQGRVLTFYQSDGLVSDVFDSRNVAYLGSNIVFNSRRGLVQFNPAKVEISHEPPQIVLTGVRVSGQDVYNEYQTAELEKLEVDYFDFNFSLSFAALDFNSPDKVRYTYQLEGLSKDWIDLGNTNEVTFSNLPEGKYTLKVKAYGSHGEESLNELKLQIQITPPFYNTLWFRISAGALIALLIGSFYLYRMRRVRVRNKLLEREVEKRTKKLQEKNRQLEVATEKALASDKAKSEFMATMSHEIRTPMNGILGSLSLLKQSQHSSEQDDQLNIIAECGDNMLAIINEILDYSKIETGKLKPVVEKFDIVASLQATIETHASRAYKKGIDLTCYIDPHVPRFVESDKSRIAQLVNNILSNSVKFTKQGFVHVEITVSSERDTGLDLMFKIEDSGIGIPKERQAEIWDAFSQVDSSSTREYGGTGLGLAICRSIANIMGGDIWMESEEGKGSTFYFTIPVTGKKRTTKRQVENKKKLLFAASNVRVNGLLSKYAGELDLEFSAFTDLQSMSSYNDDEKYDVIFVDQKTLTYEFAEGLSQMADKVYLLGPQAENLADKKLPDGVHATLALPVWRKHFEAIFIDKETVKTEEKKPEFDTESLKQLKILLAEDNRVNQMVTKKIFKKLGLELDIAENGKIAVEKQQRNNYDIILMDLLMPEMDGMEATKVIRELSGPEHPFIVAFSANIFNKEKSHFEAQGFNNVLSKPAKLDDISAILTDASQAIKA